MSILRDYQREGIDAVKEAWRNNEKPMVAVATGGGKTVMIAHLLYETLQNNTRAIVIAHTEEIVQQIQQTVQNKFDQPIGIVMGHDNELSSRIIVASRQSLQNRIQDLMKFGPISIIVIDEAHHATETNTYGQLTKLILNKNPKTKVVGFTATPLDRNNGLFDGINFSWTINDGIKTGFLVPTVPINIPLKRKKLIEQTLKAYQDHIYPSKRPCLAFFPSVASSKLFTKALKRKGIHAAHIDCKTEKVERQDILQSYQDGKISVICNMQVLTEGFDAPKTSAILLARSTKSTLLFTQIIGRGLRLQEDKKDCLVVHLTTPKSGVSLNDIF